MFMTPPGKSSSNCNGKHLNFKGSRCNCKGKRTNVSGTMIEIGGRLKLKIAIIC